MIGQRKTLTPGVVAAEASGNPTGSSRSLQSCLHIETESLQLYLSISRALVISFSPGGSITLMKCFFVADSW